MKFIHEKMTVIHMKPFIYGHIDQCRWIKITLSCKLQAQSSKFKLHAHAQAIFSWEMAESMHKIVIESIKVVVQKAKYLAISYDEVTTINNQSWCKVHTYVVDRFKWIPLLLNLEKVIGGGNANNLT
jgi:hypothetical protein